MKVVLPQFSGPYDLLLSLVGEKKLNISEMALSLVTEQFLRYLDTLEKNRAEEIADFLVVAARLLLLKSKMLLPQFSPEEDDGLCLEEQLRVYQQFVEASKTVNRLWLGTLRTVFRVEHLRKREQFSAPEGVTLDCLRETMVQLVRRLAPPKPIPETRIDRSISMKEKIDAIRDLLSGGRRVAFHDILSNARNKTDIIVSFLAILELLKQKAVAFYQDETFSDILVERV